MNIKAYISSFRLRTLPLSIAGILMGAIQASHETSISMMTLIFLLLTTLSLQILSNLSNEYGDMVKGTDNDQRLGPIRALQKGEITLNGLRNAIILFVLLSIGFGVLLLTLSLDTLFGEKGILFLLLGGLSIAAAILYTVGKHAFGYVGLGDLFVFIFFGLVSCIGSFLLLGGAWSLWILLPASSVGLLSVVVLNVNNMRDRSNDELCGKRTIPVRIGERAARIYHTCLVLVPFVLMVFYQQHINGAYWFMLALLPAIWHLNKIYHGSGRALDPQLKTGALIALFFTLLCCF